MDETYLTWPFFGETHAELASRINAWAKGLSPPPDELDVDTTCVEFVRRLGRDGWLSHVVPKPFGSSRDLDLRSLCLIRENLAWSSGLADFAFAMQGLGSAPISLHGSPVLKDQYLPRVCRGDAIGAFALSEEGAGSDVAGMKTTAQRTDDGYAVDGEKAWISNAGIADFYIVFCRYPELGDASYIALVVEADNPGLRVSSRTCVIAPHPLGTVRFQACRVSSQAVIGIPGQGMKVAFSALDIFRTTVGAAAVGLARRALDETVQHVQSRRAFGHYLSDFQLTRARLADMALSIDASALLVYRAAWVHDVRRQRITREASMAKLYATESAQQVIDDAVQLFGARGVTHGETLERLYREIRPLRIYEGTSEIQRLIIAAQVLIGMDGCKEVKRA